MEAEIVEIKARETVARMNTAQAGGHPGRVDDHQKPPAVEDEATQYPQVTVKTEIVEAGLTAEYGVADVAGTPEDAEGGLPAVAEVSQFVKAICDKARQKWEGLHWRYQQSMQDHLDQEYPRWLHEQVKFMPADLQLSAVHEMLSEPHVLLCTSTSRGTGN